MSDSSTIDLITAPLTPSNKELIEQANKEKEDRERKFGEFMVAFASLSDDDIRIKRPDPEPKESVVFPNPYTWGQAVIYPNASRWGQAALNNQNYGFDGDKSPSGVREKRHATKMYETKRSLNVLNTRLSALKEGVYKIDENGKSKLRINGSLKHLHRAQRKSIKKDEKYYQKTLNKRDKTFHKLEFSGDKEPQDYLTPFKERITENIRQASEIRRLTKDSLPRAKQVNYAHTHPVITHPVRNVIYDIPNDRAFESSVKPGRSREVADISGWAGSEQPKRRVKRMKRTMYDTKTSKTVQAHTKPLKKNQRFVDVTGWM